MKTAIVPAYPGLRSFSAEDLEDFSRDYLPGWLGMELVTVEKNRLTARVKLRQQMLGPHGFLHGGIQVSIADSLAGWGTVLNMPAGARGMLTTELKTNFLGSMREGTVLAEATPVHLGRTTQVWDCVLADEAAGRRLSVYRCTQAILWNRDPANRD
jgi:uncharacterized protein (TIGR00369 family)